MSLPLLPIREISPKSVFQPFLFCFCRLWPETLFSNTRARPAPARPIVASPMLAIAGLKTTLLADDRRGESPPIRRRRPSRTSRAGPDRLTKRSGQQALAAAGKGETGRVGAKNNHHHHKSHRRGDQPPAARSAVLPQEAERAHPGVPGEGAAVIPCVANAQIATAARRT